MWEHLTPTLIGSALTGVIVGVAAFAGMRVWIRALTERMNRAETASDEHRVGIAQVREDRQRCKAEAGQLYVSKHTFGKVLGDLKAAVEKIQDAVTSGQRETNGKIDTLHDRVTGTEKAVAEIQGELRCERKVQT